MLVNGIKSQQISLFEWYFSGFYYFFLLIESSKSGLIDLKSNFKEQLLHEPTAQLEQFVLFPDGLKNKIVL